MRAVGREYLRQPLRPFDVLDFGDDADLGKLGRDDLAALPRIGRRRQLQRQLDRRGDSGLGQQLLGLLGIVGLMPVVST